MDILDVTGAIVALDALGCPQEIAAQIREAGADHVLAVKDNQPRLLEDIHQAVADRLDQPGPEGDAGCVETIATGPGRKGVRIDTRVTDLRKIRDRELWQDLHSICMVGCERTVGGETTSAARYYLGSLPGEVGDDARVIRGPGGIEHGCPWVLDVRFREDQSRSRAEPGAEDLAWRRRRARSPLKKDTTGERSMKDRKSVV